MSLGSLVQSKNSNIKEVAKLNILFIIATSAITFTHEMISLSHETLCVALSLSGSNVSVPR